MNYCWRESEVIHIRSNSCFRLVVGHTFELTLHQIRTHHIQTNDTNRLHMMITTRTSFVIIINLYIFAPNITPTQKHQSRKLHVYQVMPIISPASEKMYNMQTYTMRNIYIVILRSLQTNHIRTLHIVNGAKPELFED